MRLVTLRLNGVTLPQEVQKGVNPAPSACVAFHTGIWFVCCDTECVISGWLRLWVLTAAHRKGHLVSANRVLH